MSVAEELRSLAGVGDADAFVALAARTVGLDKAQEIVRKSGAVRPSGIRVDLLENVSPPPTSSRRTPPSGTSAGSLEVVLDRWAVSRMESEVGDEHETGGFLFGRRSGGALRIVEATGPGPDASRGRNHVVISWAHGEALLANYRAAHGPEIAILGSWHTHACGHATRPSERDLAGVPDALDRIGGNAWLELIGASVSEASPSIRWAGWLSLRLQDGRIRTESAPLEFEGDQAWR